MPFIFKLWIHRPPQTITDCPSSCQQSEDALFRQNTYQVPVGRERVQWWCSIYPTVSVVIISWKTSKALGTLPEHYLALLPLTAATVATTPHTNMNINAVTSSTTCIYIYTVPTQWNFTQIYPTIDGQVRTMDGEQFHISIRPDAKPFCVSTPWSIRNAYSDKLKGEIDLLIS